MIPSLMCDDLLVVVVCAALGAKEWQQTCQEDKFSELNDFSALGKSRQENYGLDGWYPPGRMKCTTGCLNEPDMQAMKEWAGIDIAGQMPCRTKRGFCASVNRIP
jgi:hypothetical protein